LREAAAAVVTLAFAIEVREDTVDVLCDGKAEECERAEECELAAVFVAEDFDAADGVTVGTERFRAGSALLPD
jgi:hypothetical protein